MMSNARLEMAAVNAEELESALDDGDLFYVKEIAEDVLLDISDLLVEVRRLKKLVGE